MQAPVVSVLMPAYKAEGTICAVVGDLIRQTMPDWELLIVADDGLDYETLLRGAGLADPRIRFVANPGGTSGCPAVVRTLCLEQARGTYVAPFDADDRCGPRRLEVLVALAEQFGAAADNVVAVDIATGARIATLLPEYPRQTHRLGAAEMLETFVPIKPVVARRLGCSWHMRKEVFCDDVLYALSVIDRCGCLPVCSTVLHRYYVHPHSYTFGERGARLAEQSYRFILEEIERDNLGLKTIDPRLLADAFARRIRINSLYAEAVRGNPSLSFHAFRAAYAGRSTCAE